MWKQWTCQPCIPLHQPSGKFRLELPYVPISVTLSIIFYSTSTPPDSPTRDTRDDLMNLRVGGNRIKSIARWCHLQVAVWPGRIDIASASAWNAKYDTCPSWCQNGVRHRYTWLVAIRDGRDETWSTKDGLRMTGKMCTDSHDFLKWPMTRFRDIYLGFFVICLSLFFYFRTSNSSLDGMIGFQWCDD